MWSCGLVKLAQLTSKAKNGWKNQGADRVHFFQIRIFFRLMESVNLTYLKSHFPKNRYISLEIPILNYFRLLNGFHRMLIVLIKAMDLNIIYLSSPFNVIIQFL